MTWLPAVILVLVLFASVLAIAETAMSRMSRVRAITLREAMLLQTFPVTATLHGTGEGKAQQVGNAVPSLLAERIGDAVLAAGASASAREAAA